jgi:hypothetical protein
MSYKTPQEKKALAYEHDRRNRFGQNAKASRKAIPLRKAKTKRADRKSANQILSTAPKTIDLLADDAPENKIAGIQKKRWRKVPDVSLRDAIQAKNNWRMMRYGRKKGKRSVIEDTKGITQRKKEEPNQAPEPTAPSSRGSP